MQTRKAKFILLAIAFVFVMFFTNDFGLIDVEKTSIITAIAIDYEDDGEYTVTAQIAVPEATDTNSENLKAQLSGKGSTVGAAIKNLGDLSGWYPKLSFCNLILIGNGFDSYNVIKVLDYFAKTLRVQDSALIAMSEKKASELLEIASPLDNISSFAMQKVMFKNPGFDRDVAATNIKTFCSDHYASAKSSYMPLIKVVSSDDGQSSDEEGNASGSSSSESGMDTGSSGGSGGQEAAKKSNYLFDAKTTALFLDGVKVGELDENLSLVFNSLNGPFEGTTFSVDDVPYGESKSNYLLTVMSSKPCVNVLADHNSLELKINLDLYCKIIDQNADNSDQALSENKPLPLAVKNKAEELLNGWLKDLVETSRQTGCDFLKIKEKLYRYNHKQYSRYEKNYLSVMKTHLKVTVFGQK